MLTCNYANHMEMAKYTQWFTMHLIAQFLWQLATPFIYLLQGRELDNYF